MPLDAVGGAALGIVGGIVAVILLSEALTFPWGGRHMVAEGSQEA